MRVVYPAREVLEEPGRIIIAGARLDWKCSPLLHHLDPAAEPLEQTRPLGGRMLTTRIRERAHERLEALGLLDVMREQRLPV